MAPVRSLARTNNINPGVPYMITTYRLRMRHGLPKAYALAALAVCALIAGLPSARAQDIEPRMYSNAPVGMNFLVAGYAYTDGGLSFDPSLPIKNPQLNTSNAILAYIRAIDLWGLSAKIDAVVPQTWLSGSAERDGEILTRRVEGLTDPKIRLSVNLYGAPAVSLKEFAGYRQDLIIGASLQIAAPWGQYDPDRLVNIGTNRWYFKPEVGLSKTKGPWTLEFAAAANLYTDNTDFYGGNTRSQDPLYNFQAHAIYNLRSGIWVSVDATYFTGGKTAVNDIPDNNRQDNWRLGGTLSYPVSVRNSVKFYLSSGVSARTGNSFDLVGLAWQYRWGGGI
jgi:Putative MetA-pathway of phenol degradation